MSLFDKDNPDHRALYRMRKASWTPAKEAALQEDFKRRGIGRYRTETTKGE